MMFKTLLIPKGTYKLIVSLLQLRSSRLRETVLAIIASFLLIFLSFFA